MIHRLFKRNRSANPTSSCKQHNSLNIEVLESRMMLSTVSIYASGQTGQESMTVYAGDQVRTFSNIPVDGEVYTFEASNILADDLVTIEFTNDLYLPDQGIDRNLTVDKLVLDGVTYRTTDPIVFADGVWDPVAGEISSGSGVGPTLHANGFFDFFIESNQTGDIDFGNRTWDLVDGINTGETLSVSNSGELTMSGAAGPLAISTPLQVEANGFYRLSFEAERLVNSGQFSSDSQPWATVGIDYYDFNGSLITQDRVDVNSENPMSVQRDIQPPGSATSAYLWVWIDGFQNGTDIPLKLSDFSFEQVDISGDVTPPTAEFTSFTFDREFSNEISFGVLFQDDVWLDSNYSGSITVTGPNGFNLNPYFFTNGPDTTTTRELAIFGMRKSDGSYFNSSDNGIYTVTLNPDTVSDQNGNLAPGRVLGTFTVDLADQGIDTTPVAVNLFNADDVFAPPQGGRGSDIEFGVTFTDDRPFTFFENVIRVEGPNGYSAVAQGIAGGPSNTPDRPFGYFEILYLPLPSDGFWSSNDNGTYTIKLDSDLTDAVGNLTPAQDLGTFVVNIP